ncbi:MAG TPA: NAD(P)-dependent oxidoreductase [Longimicrobiales bacterium]|nr:NAD(P)-dependent oxidoreductase [Longimicrobiales bacterium]
MSRSPPVAPGDGVRVYLTGGTGLIGSHVAERLRQRGDQVVALVRAGSETTHLTGLGCTLVQGDLGDDPEALVTGMRGCDAVVHAAARVFRRGSRRAFIRTNVDGTRAVLGGAALAAPRVVHLSSVAVYAGLTDLALREDDWTRADPRRQGAYAASKHLSERAAWQLHERGAVHLTTLRPSVVYGERDRAATPILVRYATLPLVPLPGDGRTLLPLVYAGNVAEAVLAALDRPRSVGRAFNVALDQPVTAREVVERVHRELDPGGAAPRTVGVPRVVPAALAGVAASAGRVLPLVSGAGFARAARSLIRDNPYDSTRARVELGWRASIPHHEGLRRTMRWWRGRYLRSAPAGR